ncbi:hypothetical protein HMPREF0574_0857 [Mobiluncus curtisii subsp. curtisii ATCC 35241]|nr:hypothetical protein HMPREF0574_0857 [Mobiluncus curtisii subsp. curtisii ATCC 35241]
MIESRQTEPKTVIRARPLDSPAGINSGIWAVAAIIGSYSPISTFYPQK